MNAVDVVSSKVSMSSVMPMRLRGGLLAEGTFEDPENARIIYLAVAGLLVLAIVLGVGTWYWWRTSKVEHPALGPLEMMGSRPWRKGDFNSRAKFLEAARPTNAIHEPDPLNEPDEFDLDALVNLEAAKFDDFADLVPVAPSDAPVAAAGAVDEAAVAESVVESSAEPAGPAVSVVSDTEPEPVVEPASAPVKQGVIVIDTAPSTPAPLQLTFDEPASSGADADGSTDPDHFDPLLRLNISE